MAIPSEMDVDREECLSLKKALYELLQSNRHL